MMSYNSQGFLQQDSLHFTEGPSHFISHGQLILLNQFPNAGDVIYTIPQPSGQPVVLNQFPAADDVIYTIPPSSGQLMVQNQIPDARDGIYTIIPSSGQLMVHNQFAAPGHLIFIPPSSGQPVVLNQFPAAEDVIYIIPPSSAEGWDGSPPLLAPVWVPPFMNHYDSGVRPPRQPDSTDALYQQTDHQRSTAELPSRQMENRETERPAKRKRKKSSKVQEEADELDRPCRRARLDSGEEIFNVQIKPDAVMDEDGQITFSEEIMDLLEAVPHVLDLAKEMGFSV